MELIIRKNKRITAVRILIGRELLLLVENNYLLEGKGREGNYYWKVFIIRKELSLTGITITIEFIIRIDLQLEGNY